MLALLLTGCSPGPSDTPDDLAAPPDLTLLPDLATGPGRVTLTVTF
jgi:hypothetical protein